MLTDRQKVDLDITVAKSALHALPTRDMLRVIYDVIREDKTLPDSYGIGQILDGLHELAEDCAGSEGWTGDDLSDRYLGLDS